ncbi:M23 family metallopeptidase [Microbacterium sp. zg.Y625]|uniref:M23 family metallopeptidase n=1 Tax=Microbacterium jiangjiandongii TaxID=3049071 RepID=UPI00214CFA4E|nr:MULTISPECIES: M23 family metallopeptidase [unclassified Microbacterium]MCR2793605.1 M23 family metallopeptidase [Microbacterium sp. zg.Y625]WIM25954.1 M23 family metallopeptidase [Microbacterium sp. zg-Y625]
MTENSTSPSSATPSPGPTRRSARIAAASRARWSTLVTARAATRTPGSARRTVHVVFAVSVVVSLAGTTAIPAMAVTTQDMSDTAARPLDTSVELDAADGTTSLVAASEADAPRETQSLVVASQSDGVALDRLSYAATTPEEIAAVKQAEEAAAQAERARLAAAITNGQLAAVSAAIPAGGGVVRPLPYFDNFGTPYAGHRGVDYMVAAGTPISSVADGVVIESSESGPGWGVYVKVAHNINGVSVTTLYAHMTYGSRTVQVGDRVVAGQVIGQVGETGRAFGAHLHLEVQVNNGYVNGESWLIAHGA